MRRGMLVVLLVVVSLFTFCGAAWAGWLDTAKGLVGWQAIALVLSAALALAGVTKYTSWGSRVLIALGSFCTTLGISLSDGKIDAGELRAWKTDYGALVGAIKSGWKT